MGLQPGQSAARENREPMLELDRFVPYRLSILTNTVSRSLARLYEDEYGLTVAEWRLLAILARFGPMSANGVCERSGMDKVRVSRAVARATTRRLVHRATDKEDRRRSVLTLTDEGRSIHNRIIPLVKAREAELLSALAPGEVDVLVDMLHRLQTHASGLEDKRMNSGNAGD